MIRNRNKFGSRPRVKADQLAKQRNQPNRFRNKQRNQPTRPRNNQRTRFREQVRSQAGRPVNNNIPDSDVDDDEESNSRSQTTPSSRANVRFITPTKAPGHNGRDCSNPFKCPPKTFAGGRKPRVKSNIKALKRNYWTPRKNSRVIKRRKQVSPGIRRRIQEIRQGRKQRLEDKKDLITNDIDDEPVDGEVKATTPDPLKKLLRLVEEKEKRAKELSSFNASNARQFQNKRLDPKKSKNNFR